MFTPATGLSYASPSCQSWSPLVQAETADLIVEARRLEEEKEQLLAQLDDADKAGLEAETLLQASSGRIETLEKARNAAVEVSQ